MTAAASTARIQARRNNAPILMPLSECGRPAPAYPLVLYWLVMSASPPLFVTNA
jgi:hypothetical protein